MTACAASACPSVAGQRLDAVRKAIPGQTVTGKTDLVLAGEGPGSKYDQAMRLGVQIIQEGDFSRIVGEGPL